MAIFDKVNLGKYSVPQYQKNSNRIWALKWDSVNSNYGEIVFSDNWGSSWVTWLSLPLDKRSPLDIHPLWRDSSGNCYYADESNLYRVDGSTKAITVAITFHPSNYYWYWFNWSIAEDNDGYLYTAGYTLDPTIPTTPGTGGHFLYVSPPGGNSFVRNDYLFDNYTTNRHVHSIHVNPYNNKVYVAIGDADIGTVKNFVSDDRLATLTEITGLPQCTGITATTEGTYFSEDNPLNTNEVYVTTNDSTGSLVFTPPAPYDKTAIYYATAVGDNEMWLVTVDDVVSPTTNTAIICIKKSAGVGSPWSVANIIDEVEPETDGLNYYAIAHDGQSVIPETSPYVFVLLRDWGNSTDWGLLRIERAAIARPGARNRKSIGMGMSMSI